jgi:hypothetical protein
MSPRKILENKLTGHLIKQISHGDKQFGREENSTAETRRRRGEIFLCASASRRWKNPADGEMGERRRRGIFVENQKSKSSAP